MQFDPKLARGHDVVKMLPVGINVADLSAIYQAYHIAGQKPGLSQFWPGVGADLIPPLSGSQSKFFQKPARIGVQGIPIPGDRFVEGAGGAGRCNGSGSGGWRWQVAKIVSGIRRRGLGPFRE